MEDATDSKSVIRKGVWVRLPPPAPRSPPLKASRSTDCPPLEVRSRMLTVWRPSSVETVQSRLQNRQEERMPCVSPLLQGRLLANLGTPVRNVIKCRCGPQEPRRSGAVSTGTRNPAGSRAALPPGRYTTQDSTQASHGVQGTLPGTVGSKTDLQPRGH